MQVRLGPPRNPLEWIVAILIFGVILAFGFMLMSAVIVVVAVALIAAPIITWWRRRKGLAATPQHFPSPGPTPELPPEEMDGPIVDAEFHLKDEER